tara:strand:+ start:447 stop:683 length:237 start_codon:yes stop_codon:yes gene_type:complete
MCCFWYHYDTKIPVFGLILKIVASSNLGPGTFNIRLKMHLQGCFFNALKSAVATTMGMLDHITHGGNIRLIKATIFGM